MSLKLKLFIGCLFAILLTSFFVLLGKFFALESVTGLWVSRIGFWLVVIVMIFFARKIEGNAFLLWKEKRGGVLFHILSFLGIGVAIVVLSFMANMIFHYFEIPINREVVDRLKAVLCSRMPLLLFTCLTAGVTEELIFRGYLLPRFERLLNSSTLAILLSSLLFGLAHFSYNDIAQLVVPFLIGAVFALYYTRYRNIKVVIIFHFLYDFLAIYLTCIK